MRTGRAATRGAGVGLWTGTFSGAATSVCGATTPVRCGANVGAGVLEPDSAAADANPGVFRRPTRVRSTGTTVGEGDCTGVGRFAAGCWSFEVACGCPAGAVLPFVAVGFLRLNAERAKTLSRSCMGRETVSPCPDPSAVDSWVDWTVLPRGLDRDDTEAAALLRGADSTDVLSAADLGRIDHSELLPRGAIALPARREFDVPVVMPRPELGPADDEAGLCV